MIVIARRVGQLGNRLILFAHFVACAREHNVVVYNPAFHDYARYFEATRGDRICRYVPGRPVRDCRRGQPWDVTRAACYHAAYLPTRGLAALGCTRWPLPIIRIPMNQSFDLESREFARLLERRRLVVVQGWLFRGQAMLRRHADAIRDYFRPIRHHADRAARAATDAAARGDVVVGIHCRQGDYRTAFDGRYYYTADEYRAVMQRVARFFAPREVAFLVCGDELDHPQALASLNVSWGTGHLVEDLYAFAQCDYLVGPPSTFTGWASFYGDVPLYTLTSADAPIRFPGPARPQRPRGARRVASG